MARRRTSSVVLDDRTEDMSAEALTCRAEGHPWQKIPVSVQRQRATIRNTGTVEKRWLCLCCGAEKTATFDAGTLEPIGYPYIDYKDKSYLIKNNEGRGRLPRYEAIKADFVRQYPTLF